MVVSGDCGKSLDNQRFGSLLDFPDAFQKKISKPATNSFDGTQPLSPLPKAHFAPNLPSLLRHHKRLNRYKDYNRILDQLLDTLVPAGMLVDSGGNIIHVLGDVSAFLTPTINGDFTKDVRKRLISPLDVQVTEAMLLAEDLRCDQKLQPLTIATPENQESNLIAVKIQYITDSQSGEAYFAILFKTERERRELRPRQGEVSTAVKADTDIETFKQSFNQLQTLRQSNLELTRDNEQLIAINEQMSSRYEALLEAYQTQSHQQLVLDSVLKGKHTGFIVVSAADWELLYASLAVTSDLGLQNLTLGQDLRASGYPVLTTAITDYLAGDTDFRDPLSTRSTQSSINFKCIDDSIGGKKILITLSGSLRPEREPSLV